MGDDPESQFDLRWPVDRPGLEDAVRFLEQNSSRPFKLEDAVSEIAAHADFRSREPEKYIRSVLDKSELLGKSADGDLYIPKRILLEPLRFRVRITEFELENKVLIPGHRFFLFYYPHDGKPPNSIYWLNKKKKVGLPPLNWSARLSDLMIYFSLLPRQAIYYILQPSGKSEVIPDGIFKIRVFDLEPLLSKREVKVGDELEFRVDDFEKGTFCFEHFDKRRLLLDKMNLVGRDNRLMECVANEVEPHRPRPPLKTLLNSYAALYERGEDWHKAHTPFGPLVNRSHAVRLEFFQIIQSPVLIPEGEQVDSFFNDFHRVMLSDMGKSCENMDDLFRLSGMSLNECIVRAYIIDHLLSNDPEPDSIIKDLFSGLDSVFWNEDQWNLFKDFFGDLYDDTSRNLKVYSPTEDVARFRSVLLKQIRLHLRFLRSLDRIQVPYNQIPQDEMLKLVEIDSMMVNLLRLLESVEVTDTTSDELVQTEQQLEHIFAFWEEITQRIKKELKVVF